MKETHNSLDYLLSAVNYQEHKWLICDLKVVGLVLGHQSGYTKYPFFCISGTTKLTTNIMSDKSGH